MISRGDIVDHLLGRKILLSHSLISYLDEEYIISLTLPPWHLTVKTMVSIVNMQHMTIQIVYHEGMSATSIPCILGLVSALSIYY